MKTPDNNDAMDSRHISGNADIPIHFEPADFPVNEDLLFDEVAKKKRQGFEHIQLEADESQQHPEARTGQKETEETLLDEVAEKGRIEYPDIE